MKYKIKEKIKETLQEIGIKEAHVVLEHPLDLSMGDYSTNVAMVYAKQVRKNPKELANEIVGILSKIQSQLQVDKIQVAGSGFINFYFSKYFFANNIKIIQEKKDIWGKNKLFVGKKVMVEYTDSNPFKPFHIGHLMTNTIGESIARIFEYSGAKTIRANYQGDIGMHVAKAIWGLLKKGKGDESLSLKLKANYIGECYAFGSASYDSDTFVKKEIDEINRLLYEKSDLKINELYDWGKKITLDAFEEIYKILGTKFKYYFFESEMVSIGMKIVKENIGKIFQKSEGAIVFHAEKYNPKLHTRVFINSQGLPIYETKEIGLMMSKFSKENLDLSVVITAIEQGEYMKVVQKAFSLIKPEYESRMLHITHGMMRLDKGKMSSRKGNVVTGESLLEDTRALVYEKMNERDFKEEEKKIISSQIAVAALKYSILKQDLNKDIVFDMERSISFAGDSGPYLQYTVLRARSVLDKAKKEDIYFPLDVQTPSDWETIDLERYLYRFPEVVKRAYKSLLPHHIATYLIELSSLFNSFYVKEKIVDADDSSSSYKISLTEAFYITVTNGLYLLGIDVPEKM